MELALHIGAHATDEGVIGQWLARNEAVLAQHGVVTPAASVFLPRISEALKGLRGRAVPQVEEALLRGLGASGQRRRMVVSAPGLLGAVGDVITPEGFYSKDIARRVYGLKMLFPRCKMSFFLATRRADSFLPRLMALVPGATPETTLPMLDDESLPWSQVASDLRAHAPGASLTIWRHEDLGQVWPQVFRFLLGEGRPIPAGGLFDIAAQGLSAQGRLRAQRYLSANPPASVAQLVRVIAVFRDKYGALAERAPAADLPEWARAQLTRLSQSYATEWEDIAHIPGVRPVLPDTA